MEIGSPAKAKMIVVGSVGKVEDEIAHDMLNKDAQYQYQMEQESEEARDRQRQHRLERKNGRQEKKEIRQQEKERGE